MRFLVPVLLLSCMCSQAAWLGTWRYRQPLTLSNAQVGALANYPVQVSLTSGNFTFSQALSDCSDLRVTAPDGVTIIPYTITACNSGAQTATLWIQPASISGSGTYIPYLYWGNASPPLFDIPPAGPWAKYAGNPVINTAGVLPENMAFDPVSNKYWMVISSGGSGNVYSSMDLLTWTPGAAAGGAFHLLLSGGTWYFYTTHGTSDIYVDTASAPDGTRTLGLAPIITHGTAWKSTRVLEPYVFQDDNGAWVMFYMGDTDTGTAEQVGYATSSSPAGPWTDYASNPVLTFGAAGSYDAGTIADPWIVKLNGTYYIGYACSVNTANWLTCLATTTDLVNFTKQGLKLWVTPGTWENASAFRGAVIRVGNTYYLSYGTTAGVGIATQSAQSSASGYPPFQILGLYDDFASYDVAQWGLQPAGTTVAGSVMTVTSGVNGVVQLSSKFAFTTGNIIEVNSQRAALSTNNAGELGFNGAARARLFDNSTAAGFWILDAGTGGPGNQNSSVHPDTSYHVQSIWRKSAGETDFKVDAAVAWQAQAGTLSTAFLNAWFESFGAGGLNNTYNIDWVRVRPYSEPEPTVAFGSVQNASLGNSLFFGIP